jgi:hypothetical protein
MKFKEYLEEGKEDKFIKAIKGAVSMSQAKRYKELFHQMDMSDKERDKIKKILDDKLKSLDKKKKK